MKRYHSGEEIRSDDKILFHGANGKIEFVLNALTGDPALDWYVRESGPGAMILDPVAGRTYVHDTENAEDLILISRSTG